MKASENRYLFIGGPLHRSYVVIGDDVDAVPHGDGEYVAEDLGFEDRLFNLVYVWSGISLNEALDMVLDAVSLHEDRDSSLVNFEPLTVVQQIGNKLASASHHRQQLAAIAADFVKLHDIDPDTDAADELVDCILQGGNYEEQLRRAGQYNGRH